ncbi:hypothetical protein NVP1084O_038 [Vibrio phage 1.084.O._10N.261.49.F5]|nr:hypothetical protein NVP1084O_038 [Vibrio phage 1.084.O._10N.261.49.F5]
MIDKELEKEYLEINKKAVYEASVIFADMMFEQTEEGDIHKEKFLNLSKGSQIHQEIYNNTLKLYLTDEEINKVLQSSVDIYKITSQHHSVFKEKTEQLFVSQNESFVNQIVSQIEE